MPREVQGLAKYLLLKFDKNNAYMMYLDLWTLQNEAWHLLLMWSMAEYFYPHLQYLQNSSRQWWIPMKLKYNWTQEQNKANWTIWYCMILKAILAYLKTLSQLAHYTLLCDQNVLALAYVAWCLTFVACILVIASSLLKRVDMHTFRHDRMQSKLS